MLDRFGVSLIGVDYDAIRRAEDRELFRETVVDAGLRVPRSAIVTSIAEAERAMDDGRLPGDRAAGVHPRRARRRHRAHAGRVRRAGVRGPQRQPDQPGAARAVADRLGRVRARGDARPQRQRAGRLLDREHRPDGRPHRRQRHRRSAADPVRPPVPGAARPGAGRDPRGGRGDRRLEHPVRGQPGRRARCS